MPPVDDTLRMVVPLDEAPKPAPPPPAPAPLDDLTTLGLGVATHTTFVTTNGGYVPSKAFSIPGWIGSATNG